jgi:hypothetical protein
MSAKLSTNLKANLILSVGFVDICKEKYIERLCFKTKSQEKYLDLRKRNRRKFKTAKWQSS